MKGKINFLLISIMDVYLGSADHENKIVNLG